MTLDFIVTVHKDIGHLDLDDDYLQLHALRAGTPGDCNCYAHLNHGKRHNSISGPKPTQQEVS